MKFRVAQVWFLAGLSWLFVASSASAGPITIPPSLSPGDQYRLFFVTSAKRDATSSNINVYNAFVDAVAESVPELAALNQNWKAVASGPSIDARDNTSTNPFDPSDPDVPIFLLTGALFATGNSDFWGFKSGSNLYKARPNITEQLTSLGGQESITWTGTNFNGTRQGFGLAEIFPIFGYSANKDFSVIQWTTRFHGELHHFYAMSGVLTVPAAPASSAVPEPSSFLLLSLGVIGLVAGGLRRRRKSARCGEKAQSAAELRSLGNA